jgi:hypothetical protein
MNLRSDQSKFLLAGAALPAIQNDPANGISSLAEDLITSLASDVGMPVQ